MEACYFNSRPKGNNKEEKEKKKMLLPGKSNCYFGTEENLWDTNDSLKTS